MWIGLVAGLTPDFCSAFLFLAGEVFNPFFNSHGIAIEGAQPSIKNEPWRGVVQHGSRRAASKCGSTTAVNSCTPLTSRFLRDASPANACALACLKYIAVEHDRCGQAATCCQRQRVTAHPHWPQPMRRTKKKQSPWGTTGAGRLPHAASGNM